MESSGIFEEWNTYALRKVLVQNDRVPKILGLSMNLGMESDLMSDFLPHLGFREVVCMLITLESSSR
jgi:hypothetical protein